MPRRCDSDRERKAKLISDSYAALVTVSENAHAISFEMREAAEYDEAAVCTRMAAKKSPCSGTLPCDARKHGKELKPNKPEKPVHEEENSMRWNPNSATGRSSSRCSCPGSLPEGKASYSHGLHSVLLPQFRISFRKSALSDAPNLTRQSHISKNLHRSSLNGISEIDVAYMEFPCCGGLVKLVDAAVKRSGIGN